MQNLTNTQIRLIAMSEFDKKYPENKDIILLSVWMDAFVKAYEIFYEKQS